MPNIWFTADTHFGHFNIIEYTQRPFKSAEHMNEEIIRRWNERVKPEDTVIIVGDFCFKASLTSSVRGNGIPVNAWSYDAKLNGKKVFIEGNHDGNNGINSKIKAMIMEFGGMEVYVTHNPAECHPIYKLNICGHIHKLWKSQKRRGYTVINVGVDVWNFYPVSLMEVLDEYWALNPKKAKK